MLKIKDFFGSLSHQCVFPDKDKDTKAFTWDGKEVPRGEDNFFPLNDVAYIVEKEENKTVTIWQILPSRLPIIVGKRVAYKKGEEKDWKQHRLLPVALRDLLVQ